MNKKESLVEDTFIQLKNLEDVIAENAQGILASTMKQEIKELVKESLNEQEDEDEIELDAEVDTDADNDEMEMDMDFDDEEMDVDTDMDFDDEEMDMDMDVEDDTIDLTGASDEEILRVFKAMGDEDGIIVKKEGGMLHLSDDNEDVEYMVQLGESDDEMELDEMYDEEDEMEDEESEGVIYELELDDMGNELDEMYDDDEEEMDFDDEEEMDFDDEKYKTPSRRLKRIDSKYFEIPEEDEYVMESSKFKSKGVGMGSASKFKYDKKPNQGEGFKTKMKQGTRGVGMGKAKFEYKEGVNNSDVENKSTKKPMVKKVETKEASRTLGNGKRWGRNGLDKPKAAPRHLRVESTEVELNLLREKNEEYRKALNLFRTKLNEVATFNSNLAYATRLFTEHSTTKQEKINILRRFDSVDTLKESKNLYKSIKNELSSTSTTDNTITESLERNVVKTPSSGSAMNLIESKTYENPQFLRMKDLMGKLK